MTPTRPGPAGRDRAVDALRAVAVVGVVSGHWLVTAVVLRPDGAFAVASPLAGMPALTPVTWLFQTLGLFFFVAGYAAAGRGSADRSLARRGLARVGRLLRPVPVLLGAWAVTLAVAALVGAPGGSLRTVAKLVASPLWFLAVLLALGAITGPVRRLVLRRGAVPRLVVAAVAVVTAYDAGVLAGRATVVLTTLAAWLVPYALGVAAAAGRLDHRRTGWALLLGGAAAVVALMLLAGYPTSAVGVPGDARSNLDPPSLAAVGLATAQVGAALLIRRRLARRLAAPAATWASRAVDAVNRACLGIYLWHQSALLLVTITAARLMGRIDGLHTPPDGPAWLATRLLWLPVFAAALWAILTATRPAATRPPATRPADTAAGDAAVGGAVMGDAAAGGGRRRYGRRGCRQ